MALAVAISISAAIVQAITHPTHQVGLTTVVSASQGKSVFADDFTDPGSGWRTNPEGTSTYAYSAGAFTANTSGNFIYQREAPYDVTASSPAPHPLGGGPPQHRESASSPAQYPTGRRTASTSGDRIRRAGNVPGVGQIHAGEVQRAYDAAVGGDIEPLVSLLGPDLEWRGFEHGRWLWRKAPS